MKPALVVAVSLVIAAAVTVRVLQRPTPPDRPAGSWEPAVTR